MTHDTELPQDTQGPAVAGPVQRTVRRDLVPLEDMLERDWADPVRRLALRQALLAENKRLRDGWEAAEAQTLRAVGDLRRLRDEIERLRGIVDQHRPLADVAVRLDASISWLRDGRHAGPGIGVADMVALRLLLRNLEDA